MLRLHIDRPPDPADLVLGEETDPVISRILRVGGNAPRGKKRRQYLIRPIRERNDARGMDGRGYSAPGIVRHASRLALRRGRDRAGRKKDRCQRGKYRKKKSFPHSFLLAHQIKSGGSLWLSAASEDQMAS